MLEEEIAKHLDIIATHLDGLACHLGGIIKHATAIRDLKSSLNTLPPISKLPPEVLREIFFQHKALYVFPEKGATTWQSVSHVCRYWRLLALQCSSLWTSIRLSDKDKCIDEFLVRSNQLPLSVQWAVYPSKSGATERVLATEMTRIEDLHLTLYYVYPHQTPNPLTADSAPLLRRLSLNTNTKHNRVDDNLSICSNILYNGAAPQLQDLRISSIDFRWLPGFRHPNMRELRILRAPGVSVTVQDITAALDAMPLLEVLILHRGLPDNIPPLQHGDHIVTLRQLRSIAIAGISFECANFLTYLEFPSDSSIRLGSTTLSHLSPLEPLQICMARFAEVYPSHHLIFDRTTAVRFAPVGEAPEPVNTTYEDLYAVRTLPELIMFSNHDMFSPICESLPLTGVIELTIRAPHQEVFTMDRREMLTNAFRKMPNIQTLYAHNTYAQQYEDLEPTHSSILIPNTCPDSNVLPRLRELKLQHAFLESDHAERVTTYLKETLEYSLKLERVTFMKSLVPEDRRHIITSNLQTFVGTVTWDPPRPDDYLGQYSNDSVCARELTSEIDCHRLSK